MNLFSKNDDGYTVLCGGIIAIGIMAAILLSYVEHTTPKPPITAESVGKATGKTAIKFTKGFIKGTWEVIKGN